MTPVPDELAERFRDAEPSLADAELDSADAELDLGDAELDLADADVLSSADFEGRCPEIAASLLGTHLLYETPEGIAAGIVTETEAYLGTTDPACHLYGGPTPRTEPFFSGAGTIYVYEIWGHGNLDVITAFESRPECVLIRSLEPTVSLDRMRERRGRDARDELTTGPGRLTEALGIEKADVNDVAIDDSTLWLLDPGPDAKPDVERSSRIGVSEAADWPLRFCARDSAFLSKPIQAWSDDSFRLADHYEDAGVSGGEDGATE